MNDLTIIIPLYNHSKELPLCLESLLRIIDDRMTILIVDDGSTDDGYSVALEYAKGNKSVEVIHKENGGVSSARNYGLKHANSKYVTFCDPDDIVNTKSSYRKLIDLMQNNNYDYLVFNFCYNKNGKIIPNEQFPTKDIIVEKKEDLEYLRATSFVGSMNNLGIDYFNGGAYTWCKIYDLSIIKNNNLLFDSEINFSEDALYNFIYVSYINKAIITNEKLYYYSDYDTNTTNRYKEDIARNYDVFYKKTKELENGSIIIKNAYYARLIRNLTNLLRYSTFNKGNSNKCKVEDVLNEYPYYTVAIKNVKYKNLSKKQRIFAFFLKHKMYGIVKLMFKI